jgi:lysophospholipase L1-like esterase
VIRSQHFLNLTWFTSTTLYALLYITQGLVPIPKGGTVFQGDSDIDYWLQSGDIVPDSLNVGVGGDTCADVLFSIDSLLEELEPSWVVIVCGENDIAYGASASEAFDNFKAIVLKTTATGAQMLYLGTKPEPGTTELHGAYQVYDGLIKNHAMTLADDSMTHPPLTVIDVYSAFEIRGNPNSLYASDDLHMSVEGYDLWGSWVTAALFDTNDAYDCVIWANGECSTSQPRTSPSASPSASPSSAMPSASPSTSPSTSPSESPRASPSASQSASPSASPIGLSGDMSNEAAPMTGEPSGSSGVTPAPMTGEPSGSSGATPTVSIVSKLLFLATGIYLSF